MENTNEVKVGEATYIVRRTFGQRQTLKELLTDHLVEKRKQEKALEEKNADEIA